MKTPSFWKMAAFGVCVLSLYATAWSCGGQEPPVTKPPENKTVTTKLTYYKDVKPILNQSCVSCHQEGGIGPWDLSTSEKVKQIAALVGQAVKSRRMPPWQPSGGCQEYVGDSSLSDAQIKAIVEWAEGGAPEGDAADDAAKPPPAPVGITRKDLTLQMKAPFDQYKKPDDYRCFAVDWPLKEKAYITGVQVNPGNTAVAHHVIAVVVGPSELEKLAKLEDADDKPGYECYGSPGQGLRTTNLGSWVPGAQQRNFPAGSGIMVEPGSKVIMQMHYNVLTDNPKPDQTSISFKIDKSVDKVYSTVPVTNPQWILNDTMKIPAGDPAASHSFSFDPSVGFLGRSFTNGKEVMLQAVTIHMHQRGKSGKIAIKHEDGSETCLLDIPRWDFNWQGQYRFTQPVLFKPGDKLSISCVWDNSAGNQPLIDGKRIAPVDIKWGEGTQDEMCLGAVTFLNKD